MYLNKITQYLNRHIVGNVYDQPAILSAYSADHSILHAMPRFVAVPENTADIQFLLRFVSSFAKKKLKLPVAIRGSGLDKTGAAISNGLIISTENLNQIQEIDEHSRLVRVQSGVTLESLNNFLKSHGLTIPIKVQPNATIGGLIAGFNADPFASKYGSIYKFVDRIEAVLPNGEIFQSVSLNRRGLKRLDSLGSTESKIYQSIYDLLQENSDLIQELIDSTPSFSGYHMVTRVQDSHRGFDLLPLFFASCGTLAVITEVIIRCVPLSRPDRTAFFEFESIRPALAASKTLFKLNPISVDLIDNRILKNSTTNGKTFPFEQEINSRGYTISAKFNSHPFIFKHQMRKLAKIPARQSLISEPNESTNLLDSVLLNYLNSDPIKRRYPLVDNVLIEPDRFSDFSADLFKLETSIGQSLPIYGSLATNLYSVRPAFNISNPLDRRNMLNFLQKYAKTVSDHRGALAGGADGRLKAAFSNRQFNPREKELYQTIKQIFDPANILNPDAKLGSDLKKIVRQLRSDSPNHIILP